ncbi:hypothetical protein [Nonomuraea sp. NPDC052265]
MHRERELQGLPEGTILNIFEHFAADLVARPPADMRTLLGRARAR